MSYFLGFFQYISDMGATVMMPIIICVMGCILGAGFGKSLRAGLTVGIGFIGLNLVTGLMGNNLAPAVSQMAERFGLSLSVIDVGWPDAAQIYSWNSDYSGLSCCKYCNAADKHNTDC